jgi:hypothetical protein
VDTTYTFTFTNGTAGSADYTTTSQTVTVPAGATTELFLYQQLLILLQNPMRPLLLLWNASATGTINDAAPTVATIAASATEGSPAVFEFSLSNLLLWIQRIPLHSPMELLKC